MTDTSRDPWSIDEADFPRNDPVESMRFLVRYAVLAPSSHNTQPWQFAIEPNRIDVFADSSRWLKVADADKRELYLSVGCAIENLLVAAEHFGLGYSLDLFPDSSSEDLVARFVAEGPVRRSGFRGPELFESLTTRYTNHKKYERRELTSVQLEKLTGCNVEEDLRLELIAEPQAAALVEKLIAAGDETEYADPRFRAELGHWIGRGVFGTAPLLARIGRFAVERFDLGKIQARKDIQLVESSSALAVISARNNRRPNQVRAGQLFQRLFLMATRLGIAVQPMSAPLQVPGLKFELRRVLEDPVWTPLHLFRLGFALRKESHTPRRPLEEVLVE